jgi:hypothetical protein
MPSPTDPLVWSHGVKLERKAAADDTLRNVLESYRRWKSAATSVTGRTRRDIAQLVQLVDAYKNEVEPVLDRRANAAQEVLVSSIMEEFFEQLFCRLDAATGCEVPVRQPAATYLDLVFHPKSFSTLAVQPEYTIRAKDQDFVIGGAVTLSLKGQLSSASSESRLVIPAVAIECKRYLERNMLDECAGTAERVKRATPYCLFLVVAEYLKMDDAAPELTQIDEIFILRKQRNSERNAPGFVPNPIDPDLVCQLYDLVMAHLRRVWWDPNSALTNGRLFNFRTV